MNRNASQGFDGTDWSYFQPFITCPPDRPMKRYGGGGDGGKILCSLDTSLQSTGSCVVYSLGSNVSAGESQTGDKTLLCAAVKLC